MMIVHNILLALSVWTAHVQDTPPPFHEVSRSAGGDFVCLTGAWEGGKRSRVVLIGASDGLNDMMYRPGPEFESTVPVIENVRPGGPLSSGVVDGSYYIWTHTRHLQRDGFEGESVRATSRLHAGLYQLSDIIEAERLEWRGEAVRPIVARVTDFWIQHAALCTPLVQMIRSYAVELSKNWDLYYDIVYLSYDEVIAGASRNNTMFIWTLQGTGRDMGEWTARDPFPTPIDGPFCIMRAGPDLERLFFIDETGGIHTGFGAEHRTIGSVRNWSSENPDTLTLIFEDQKTQRIGFFHSAADHTMTILDIEWIDNSFADDFIDEMESDELRLNLNRMADALREDRPGEE